MRLFLSIHKRQVLIVLASLIIITSFIIFNISEAAMFILIILGATLTFRGISSIVVCHLSTPSIFRSCDIKFFKGLLCILLR